MRLGTPYRGLWYRGYGIEYRGMVPYKGCVAACLIKTKQMSLMFQPRREFAPIWCQLWAAIKKAADAI